MRRPTRPLLAALLVLLPGAASGGRDPLVSTYSIVARDPATGSFGVAVQSHWFQVGTVVPWAEAGVGAVATQSLVRVDYGPEGLALMRRGVAPRQALDRLLAADPGRDVRQVAMVDRHGRVAAWTGSKAIAAAGDLQGAGYSVQANLMAGDTVWAAMARAYETSSADFAGRLLAALEAAESEGGDLRGRQSAALLVVRAESTGEAWRDRLVDLRVEDHPRPLAELRRLLAVDRAYEALGEGDEALGRGELAVAEAHYRRAAELAPGQLELPFWQAVALFTAGHEKRALEVFARVFAADPRWLELARRLPAAGLLPDDPEKLAPILATAPGGGPPR